MVDWLVDLLIETIKAHDWKEIPGTALNMASQVERLEKGIPLLDKNLLPLDVDAVKKLYDRLVDITEKHRGGRVSGLDSILSGSKPEMTTVLRDVLKMNSLSLEAICKKKDVDPKAAEFLLRLALKPSLRRLSRISDEMDLDSWSSGYCPICGSIPVLSVFTKDKSERWLFCSLCDAPWKYPGSRCPFCGNDNRKDMRYSYAEEHESFRVAMCTHCRQGIKTVYSDEGVNDIIPLLDDLITTHLAMAVEGNHMNLQQSSG